MKDNEKLAENKFKKIIEEHLVFIWAISSVVVGFIIHCLFSKNALNEWFVAKWTAGECLTYISTVALGLLAVWQNKKFKEENDIMQSRMENLTKKANELSVISKVIEYESDFISRMREKMDAFVMVCDTEDTTLDISDVAQQPADFRKIYLKIKMENREKRIRHSASVLLSEMKICTDETDIIEFIDLISEYSNSSIELVRAVRKGPLDEQIYNIKRELEKQFMKQSLEFISKRESKLNRVIYEELTLEQIRDLYQKP